MSAGLERRWFHRQANGNLRLAKPPLWPVSGDQMDQDVLREHGVIDAMIEAWGYDRRQVLEGADPCNDESPSWTAMGFQHRQSPAVLVLICLMGQVYAVKCGNFLEAYRFLAEVSATTPFAGEAAGDPGEDDDEAVEEST
jgi:hypothetical protein